MSSQSLDRVLDIEEAAEIISKNSGETISTSQIRVYCRQYAKDSATGLKSIKKGNKWFIDRTAAMKFKRPRPGPKIK